MPCIPIENGILCTGNEPLSVKYKKVRYLFEWTAASGWCPVNLDGSQRLRPVPSAAWDKFLNSPHCLAWDRAQRLKEQKIMTTDTAIYRVSTQMQPTEINVALAKGIEQLREERIELYKKIEKLEEESM